MNKQKVKSIVQHYIKVAGYSYPLKDVYYETMDEIARDMRKKDWLLDMFDIGGSFKPSTNMARLEKAVSDYIDTLDETEFEY